MATLKSLILSGVVVVASSGIASAHRAGMVPTLRCRITLGWWLNTVATPPSSPQWTSTALSSQKNRRSDSRQTHSSAWSSQSWHPRGSNPACCSSGLARAY